MSRAVLVIAILMVVTAVVLVVMRRRPATGAIAEHGARLLTAVPATPEAIALLERWRDRASRWRFALGVPTVLGTIAASIVVRQSLDVGVGDHPAWADPLLMGLLSVFVGAIAAELHHLRPRREGPRVADLRPRDVASHLAPGARRRLTVLGGLAGSSTVAGFAVGTGPVPILGLLAIVVAAGIPMVQRGIVGRARPALPADLRAADDAVRTLAVRSVDQAGAGVVVLLTAWQLAPVYTAIEVSGPLSVVLIAAQLAALVVAIVWWRRSNPRRLLPDVRGALARVDRSTANA